MSVVTKTILKSYFNTGDKPTETQFGNLIDSLLHVDDAGGGSGSSVIIDSSGGSGSGAVDAGNLVEKIILTGTSSGNVKIGTTAGGDDIMPEIPFVSNQPQVITVDYYFASAGTVHVTGTVTAKLLLR